MSLKSDIVKKLRALGISCSIGDAIYLAEKAGKYGIGITEIVRAAKVVLVQGKDTDKETGDSIYGGRPSALNVIAILKDVYEPKSVPQAVSGSGETYEGLTTMESSAINSGVDQSSSEDAVEALVFFKNNCRHQSASSKVDIFLKMQNYGISLREMEDQIDPAEREYAGIIFNKAIDAKDAASNKDVILIPNYDQRKMYVIYPDKPAPMKARIMFGYEGDNYDAPVGSVGILKIGQYGLRRDNQVDLATARAVLQGWNDEF